MRRYQRLRYTGPTRFTGEEIKQRFDLLSGGERRIIDQQVQWLIRGVKDTTPDAARSLGPVAALEVLACLGALLEEKPLQK